MASSRMMRSPPAAALRVACCWPAQFSERPRRAPCITNRIQTPSRDCYKLAQLLVWEYFQQFVGQSTVKKIMVGKQTEKWRRNDVVTSTLPQLWLFGITHRAIMLYGLYCWSILSVCLSVRRSVPASVRQFARPCVRSSKKIMVGKQWKMT